MVDPIQPKLDNPMNGVAQGIDDVLNGDARPKRYAFVLLVAEFDKIDGGRVNYIGNGERGDCTAMMRETLARFDGRYVDTPGNA